jgi:hypothetical protein
MLCFQRLDCNFVLSIAPLVDALAAGLLSGFVCARVCATSNSGHTVVKFRNSCAADGEVASCDDIGEEYLIESLSKGGNIILINMAVYGNKRRMAAYQG